MAFACSGEYVGFGVCAGRVPDRDMRVTAVAGQALDGFGHECCAVAVLFRDAFGHEFKERMLVCGFHRIVKIPVHLPLAIRVLVVVLVGVPAQFKHVIGDFTDHVQTPHKRLLVITRLGGGIEGVADLVALGGQQEKLCLDAGFDVHAFFGGFGNQAAQHVARRLGDGFAFHDAIGRHPCDCLVPWQDDHGLGVGYGQHVGMRGRQVQPCGKAGKTCTVFLHARDGACRNQLGALAAKQVSERNHEVFDAVFFGELCEVRSHLCVFPVVFYKQKRIIAFVQKARARACLPRPFKLV